jgi:hypothetical protein
MTPAALAPAAFAVLIAWMLYRRFRRLFGRQRVQPTRLKFRIAVLLLAGAFVVLRGLVQMDVALGALAGLGGGVALGLLGIRWTRFENTPQGSFYTPHSAIGIALAALLVARLAYRFVVLYPDLQAAHGAGDPDPFAGLQHSPLTAAMLALLIGYYVTYYIGVLLRSGATAADPRRITAPDKSDPF